MTQRDLERERAKAAWEAVEKVNGKDLLKEYASLARNAPTDIMANGLGQTLAFWRAKAKDAKKDNGHAKIFEHLAEWLSESRHQFGIQNKKVMDWIVNLKDMDDYRRATSESIAFLIWVKRFVEAKVD